MSDKVKLFEIQSIPDLDPASTLIAEAKGADSLSSNLSGSDNPAYGMYGFEEIVSGSANMLPNWGYIANNASPVNLTLPVICDFGKRIIVTGKGAGGWAILQGAGQQIIFGHTQTTAGSGGSLESTEQYDAVELLCIQANTLFLVMASVGNIAVY